MLCVALLIAMILPWPPTMADRDGISAMEQALGVRHDLRYLLGLLLQMSAGLLAALGLAWFMSYLIQSSDMRLDQANRLLMLDFVRVKPEEQIEKKEKHQLIKE